MKKALIFLALLLFALTFTVCVAADNGEIPDGAVWRVESADGSISFSDDFFVCGHFLLYNPCALRYNKTVYLYSVFRYKEVLLWQTKQC